MPSISHPLAGVAGTIALVLLMGGAGVLPGAGAQTVGTASVTVPTDPYRILDTRNGIGNGGITAPIGAGQAITVQIAGVGPVPADATGIVINLTVSNGTASGSYITAWPTGTSRPDTSVINIVAGQDTANMITANLGGGRLDLYNFSGTVHLIADVAGYLIPGAGSGVPGPQGPQGPPGPSGIPPQQTLELVAYGAVGDVFPFGHGCMVLDNLLPNMEANLALPLPAGAVITAVRARYRDGSAANNISIDLWHVTGFAGGVSASSGPSSAAFTSSGTTLGEVAFLNLDANLPPVSESTMYYLRGFSAQQSPSLMLCGASVDYTLG